MVKSGSIFHPGQKIDWDGYSWWQGSHPRRGRLVQQDLLWWQREGHSIDWGSEFGQSILNDLAGNVLLEGGESAGNGIGGRSIKLKSGRGSISGILKLATSDANRMKQGSGPIHINSGQVSLGVSGNLVLETGSASLDRVARVQSKSKVGHQATSAGTAASILTVTETFQTMKVEQLNLFLVRSMMESAGHST